MLRDLYVKRVVFNRTKEIIRCMNDDGVFIDLFPMGDGVPLPKYEPNVCYIATFEEYQIVRRTERGALDFVCVAGEPAKGRANTDFYYLISYEEKTSDTKACLHVTPCSLDLYEKRDPRHRLYKSLNI